MTISSTQYTVTTTRSVIVADDQAAEEVHIHATSGAFYIGGANVTSANGYLVDHKDKVVLQNHGNAVYGITALLSETVGVLVIQK
tara:strand:- start:543 stop:797 length:255 start_codon:yes stop_codon:yes gene_type:complete